MTPSQEKYMRQRLAFAEFIKLYPLTIENLDGEEWRAIDGFDGYQVSSFGRVKSFKQGKTIILKPRLDKNGYLFVGLYLRGKQRFIKLHRLVAKAFIANSENKREVNHLDGDKFNNHVSNLEWATSSENIKHAFDIGLRKSAQGKGNYQTGVTNEQATYIRDNPDNLSLRELAERFGVTKNAIFLIQTGKTYKNAGGQTRGAKPKKPRVPNEIRAQIRAEYIKGDRERGAHALAKKIWLYSQYDLENSYRIKIQ